MRRFNNLFFLLDIVLKNIKRLIKRLKYRLYIVF